MDFWKPNIGRGGRRLRLLLAIGFTLAGIAVWLTTNSFWPTLMLAISAAFVLFEALRGWCVVRACKLASNR